MLFGAGLAMYFRADDYFDVSLVRVFLRHLRSIESWFNSQSSYCFIASSLLFIYDGDAVRLPPNKAGKFTDDLSGPCYSGSACNSTSVNCTSGSANDERNGYQEPCENGSDSYWEDHISLKMIDFTHCSPVSSPDENYLTGLRSLIDYMSRLKPRMYAPDQ